MIVLMVEVKPIIATIELQQFQLLHRICGVAGISTCSWNHSFLIMVSAFWVVNASLTHRTSHHSRAKWRLSFQICCECEACPLPYAIQRVIHMHTQHRLSIVRSILHNIASMFTFSFGYVSSCWKSKWHNCMAQNTKRKWKISVSRSKRKEVKPNSKQIQHVVPWHRNTSDANVENIFLAFDRHLNCTRMM